MKKLIVLLSLVVGSGAVYAQGAMVAVPRTAQPSMRVPVETKAVKGAPYSAEIAIESTQTLADGNRIVHRSTGRVYRSSDGLVRREEDTTSGSPTISILDPGTGVSYVLDTEQRIAWKTATPLAIMRALDASKLEVSKLVEVARTEEARRQAEEKAAQAAGDAKTAKAEEVRKMVEEDLQALQAKLRSATPSTAAGGGGGRGGGAAAGGRGRGGFAASPEQRVEEKLADRMIGNVRAEGVRRTTTIPAGQIGNELPINIVSEEWTSPDLQVLVLTQHTDPRIGESSYRLLNVTRSEPNPTLFQVPSDYTIRETGIRRVVRQ